MNLTETQSTALKSQEKFEIISNFSPSGDQPNAIKTLVQNLRDRENEQVLLVLRDLVRLLQWRK